MLGSLIHQHYHTVMTSPAQRSFFWRRMIFLHGEISSWSHTGYFSDFRASAPRERFQIHKRLNNAHSPVLMRLYILDMDVTFKMMHGLSNRQIQLEMRDYNLSGVLRNIGVRVCEGTIASFFSVNSIFYPAQPVLLYPANLGTCVALRFFPYGRLGTETSDLHLLTIDYGRRLNKARMPVPVLVFISRSCFLCFFCHRFFSSFSSLTTRSFEALSIPIKFLRCSR